MVAGSCNTLLPIMGGCCISNKVATEPIQFSSALFLENRRSTASDISGEDGKPLIEREIHRLEGMQEIFLFYRIV
jgi:hypothetical protein